MWVTYYYVILLLYNIFNILKFSLLLQQPNVSKEVVEVTTRQIERMFLSFKDVVPASLWYIST